MVYQDSINIEPLQSFSPDVPQFTKTSPRSSPEVGSPLIEVKNAPTLKLPVLKINLCIPEQLEQDHDHHNVMVVVLEWLKTQLVVTLEDSEGEFLHCEPAYRDTPTQCTRLAEDTELIESLQQQLG